MPKEKNYKLDIPAIYKKQAEDLIMMGWVFAIKELAPSTTVKKAVEMFLNFCDLSEDDQSLSTAEITFVKCKEAFLKRNKTM